MIGYYKVKLRHVRDSSEVWLPLQASTEGEAIVKADLVCLDLAYTICCDFTLAEISQREHLGLLSATTLTVRG